MQNKNCIFRANQGIDIERARGIEGNFASRAKKRGRHDSSARPPLSPRTQDPLSPDIVAYYGFIDFSTATTTTTNTSLAQIWEGIDLFTLIPARLALALSLVVSRPRLTLLVFSGSGSRRLALYHLLCSATHDSKKITGNLSSSKKSTFR